MRSPWVKVEIAKARRREVEEGRRVLFPIALAPFSDIKAWEQFNADLGEDTAREIREYFIVDFSSWKTNRAAYQMTLEKLIRSLKTEHLV